MGTVILVLTPLANKIANKRTQSARTPVSLELNGRFCVYLCHSSWPNGLQLINSMAEMLLEVLARGSKMAVNGIRRIEYKSSGLITRGANLRWGVLEINTNVYKFCNSVLSFAKNKGFPVKTTTF